MNIYCWKATNILPDLQTGDGKVSYIDSHKPSMCLKILNDIFRNTNIN